MRAPLNTFVGGKSRMNQYPTDFRSYDSMEGIAAVEREAPPRRSESWPQSSFTSLSGSAGRGYRSRCEPHHGLWRSSLQRLRPSHRRACRHFTDSFIDNASLYEQSDESDI
jgi:hypothetical protein